MPQVYEPFHRHELLAGAEFLDRMSASEVLGERAAGDSVRCGACRSCGARIPDPWQ